MYPIVFGQFALAILAVFLPAGYNLEYEYTFTLSLLLIVSAAVVSLISPSKWFPLQPTTVRVVGLIMSPLVTFTPGLVAFSSGHCQCSFNGFVFWMVLQTLPSAWLAVGLIKVASTFHEKRRRLGQWAIAMLPWFSLSLSISLIYLFPQKRITSLSLGFAHGPIYDRLIEVDPGVLFVRIGHGLLGICMIASSHRWLRLRRVQLGFFALISGLVFVVGSRYPSQTIGVHSLERALPKVLARGDVKVYYEEDGTRSDQLARDLVNDAFFHVHEVKTLLGISKPLEIKIFAYNSERKKKIYFGGSETDVTDVWTPTVHVQLEESPHGSLRHELVHAVASFVSWRSLGFHPNMVLTEGLAMALAPVDSPLTMDQIAAGLIHSGRLTNVETLFNPLGFWSEGGGRSYAVAGSFIRWMGLQYGPSSVRAIYQGDDIQNVTGQEPRRLIDAWKQDVLSVYSERQGILVESLTREPSVLADVCPHSSVDLARRPSEGWSIRARQPWGWDPSHWWAWRLSLNPGDRSVRIEIAKNAIRDLLESSHVDLTGLSSWVEALKKLRHWPPKVVEDVEAGLIESDVLFLMGEEEESTALLQDLHKFIATRQVGSSIARQIAVRLELSQNQDRAYRSPWLRYVAGWGPLPKPRQLEKSWIEIYLRGRRDHNPSLEVLRLWESYLPSVAGYPEILLEWHKMIAMGWFRRGDLERAATAYDEIAKKAHGDFKLLAEEHARRMRFLNRHNP
jgi:hypothetical protein